jgi:hypothetical protein
VKYRKLFAHFKALETKGLSLFSKKRKKKKKKKKEGLSLS